MRRHFASLLLCCLFFIPGPVKAQEVVPCKGDLNNLYPGMADRHIGFSFPSDVTAVTGFARNNNDFSYSCMTSKGIVSVRFIVGKEVRQFSDDKLIAENSIEDYSLKQERIGNVILLLGEINTIAIIRSDIDYPAIVILEVPEKDSDLWKFVRFYSEVQK